MHFSARRILLKSLMGMALLLVATLALPQAARASCGDYLIINSKASSSSGPMSSNDIPAHSKPHNPLGPDVPCSGPNCSRRSLPPAPAPAPTPERNGEEWGYMPVSLQKANPFSVGSICTVSSPAPIYRGLVIYHPPR